MAIPTSVGRKRLPQAATGDIVEANAWNMFLLEETTKHIHTKEERPGVLSIQLDTLW